jgi:mono/diheme cytochrome c family protein
MTRLSPALNILWALALSLASFDAPAQQPARERIRANKDQQALTAHGRYLVRIAGCNECHTPGYLQANGKVDEKLWLTGDKVGWNGPWGTTYASNLRVYMNKLDEEQWIKTAKTFEARPPMPWFNLKAMNERDLRAIYRFVRALGPAGEPAPAFLPPDREPPPPFFKAP